MPVGLLLGAGGNVGRAVALKLISNGYKVACASRHGADPTNGQTLGIKADVANIQDINNAFKATEKSLGSLPNVVVYNVSAYSPAPTPGDAFSLPYHQFIHDLSVGGLNAYVAMQQALTAFRTTPTEFPKVFIATGNLLGVKPAPASANMFTLGGLKRNLAYLVEAAVKNYERDGFRFYFASQVTQDGKLPKSEFNGEAHGIAYWDLIQRKGQGSWDVRFIKDGSIYQPERKNPTNI